MVSTELREKARRFAIVQGVIRKANFMQGIQGVVATDVTTVLDELVREGFLVGPIALPRAVHAGPKTITVYVLKELYPTLTEIWTRNDVLYGGAK